MKGSWLSILVFAQCLGLAVNVAAQSEATKTVSRELSQKEAVRLAQAINASEADIFSRTHQYLGMEQLLQAPAFKDRKALPAPLEPSGQLKDHYLRLLASSDGRHYMMSITPTAAGCGFSVFTDETAAIYPAGPLDCDEEHDAHEDPAN
jgi:hypothetical protein